MDLSDLKVSVYELIGLIVPGLILICEGWILVRGWNEFARSLGAIGGTRFVLLVVASGVVGHLIQELSDAVVMALRGRRYLRQGRDRFWKTAQADALRSMIWSECGVALNNVDAAYDYCLTRIGDAFAKRDAFIATSDFSRAMVLLAACGFAPMSRILHDRASPHWAFAVSYVLLLLLTIALAWSRMVRFRRIADVAVFHAYLGSRPREEDSLNKAPSQAG